MNDKLLKPYNPTETEERIYKLWEESGYFNPDNLPGERAEAFSIVLPPPNVTGTLHTGHADMLAIEDIAVRFARMRDKKTLWIPGTDHAAIATQSKVEKELVKKEDKNRHDLGREEFLKRVNDFAQESHDTIVNQVKRMGASLDWSREAFTLDEARNHAVNTAFKKMYDAGLIYRGHRVVNWDPKGQTTVSDDEVVHEETKAKLYTFRYREGFPIPIATTRPETKVGDTAVAVHPDDSRYKEFIGKEYDIEFAGTQIHIKVIADETIDPEFGTGALGVTPAHSQLDFEMAEKNGLPMKIVINEYAKMTDEAGSLVSGLKTKEAREKIVEWLKENNLLEDEEEIVQNLSKAERSGGTIEPLPKLQWFIDTDKPVAERGNKTLKELMRESVESGEIQILPNRFNKTYYHWIDNLKPWNISRQIWYGHRIPVWYKGDELQVRNDSPGEGWEQDPDTLDTWFSSGLWTFSTLGWPNKTKDLKTYHPTTLLETGYDILFFWVARMILMSQFLIGEVPFKTVYLHGLIRDEKGRKMSKSLGNIVDPVDLIDKYGADALRMGMIVGNGPGNDVNLAENKIKAYKNFANKLWNVSRFVLENTQDLNHSEKPELLESDKKRISQLEDLIKEITPEMEEYKYYLVGEKLYHYVWDTLASEIIEEKKEILNSNDETGRKSAQWTLYYLLATSLKLLHPFMPFITEELWSMMPHKDKKLLIIEEWPEI